MLRKKGSNFCSTVGSASYRIAIETSTTTVAKKVGNYTQFALEHFLHYHFSETVTKVIKIVEILYTDSLKVTQAVTRLKKRADVSI